jgi:hypothetical protein
MRTVATFDSREFNLTEHRDHFINEGCYGDGLGRWLVVRLRATGIETDPEPRPEDFGWYVNYIVDDEKFCAVIGNVGEEFWFVAVERVAGILSSVFGGRRRRIPKSGVMRLHDILSAAPEVSNLRWHHWEAFRRGGATAFAEGQPTPDAP